MRDVFAKDFFRKYIRHPRVYSYARRAMLVGQRIARRPDDADFVAFQHMKLPKDGLIIDIGANGGQAAVAFSFLLPKMKILSFEPNPAVWPDLDFISKILGPRFHYEKIGIGSQSSTMDLYVPYVDGLPITTRGSIDPLAAKQHCETLSNELEREVSIEETRVDIRPLDSFNLLPHAIKIDVEGYESEVLKGMKRTLEEARPILMLESNTNDVTCQQFLKSLNYTFVVYDAKKRTLVKMSNGIANNWFAIPAENENDIMSRHAHGAYGTENIK